MSKVIPKEQLTAYQRWELNAFDETNPGRRSPRDQADPAAQASQVNLPTAEQIEGIHQQAWQEGYDLGLEEGRKAGLDAGREVVERETRRLQALVEALNTARLLQDERVANEILELALGVAQQVVRASLKVAPELILEALREALLSLPSLTGHHKIVVHPDNAAQVKEWLGHEHGHLSWKVLEDERMEPGGFRFESAHSELDASLPARWREIIACLGSDTAWIVP